MNKWLKISIALVSLLLVVAPAAGCLKGPTGLTEDQFKRLLTLQDIQKLSTPSNIELKGNFYNYKAAPDVDPVRTLHMNSYYGIVFMSDDTSTGIALTVVDFDTITALQQNLRSIQAESQLQRMENPVGTASLKREFNARGLGSVLVFQKGSTLVELLTGVPDGATPFMTLQNLEVLARQIAGKF